MTWNLAQLMCFFGAMEAALLGLVTFFWMAKNRKANRLLAGVFAIKGLLLWLASFRFGQVSLETFPYPLVHLWGTAAMLVSPLLYLYIRVSVGGYRFRASSLLHFLPPLIHLCLLIPIGLVEGEQRLQLIHRYHELALYRSFIPGLRIGAVQAVFYWVSCFVWVRRLERHIHETASFSDRLHLLWLKWLTGLLVVLLLLLVFGKLLDPFGVEFWGVLAFTGFLTAVNVVALAKPTLLHGLPSLLQMPPEQLAETLPAPPEGPISAQSSQDDTRIQLQLEKVHAYFLKERPFLKEELTLEGLSEELALSRSLLSQVINEGSGKNFYDFVNDYRIEAAQQLLLNPAAAHLSIDGIAFEVGFRSRSVFFTAFKKRVGTSPSAWRQAQQGANG